ncbi:hypothetical protein V5799_005433 [Amblyomma americanum]|uniref:NADH dehydrogenase [ubiquinone] 1 alpha subcomplex subunit 13 n=1 Tax=Amblyomma americanum TaxID=6943 RepID=A0AAQ4DZ98_AMBAM
MSSSGFKQEMPPEGGYAPFNIKRIPARTLFSGYKLFGLYFGFTGIAWYLLKTQIVRRNVMDLVTTCLDMASFRKMPVVWLTLPL